MVGDGLQVAGKDLCLATKPAENHKQIVIGPYQLGGHQFDMLSSVLR